MSNVDRFNRSTEERDRAAKHERNKGKPMEQVAPARVCGDAIDPGAVDTQALVLPDGIGAEDDEDQDGNEAKGMIRRAAAWRFKYNPIKSSGSQDVEMHDIEMHDSQPAAERQRQLDWLRAVHMSNLDAAYYADKAAAVNLERTSSALQVHMSYASGSNAHNQ